VSKKISNAIEYLSIGSLKVILLAAFILVVNLFVPQYGYAAAPSVKGAEDVIQPFELTNPAATREQAYDEVAELNKDPKALIKAENKEEQAQEDLLKQEAKGIKFDGSSRK
jgi:hypothetical protein